MLLVQSFYKFKKDELNLYKTIMVSMQVSENKRLVYNVTQNPICELFYN